LAPDLSLLFRKWFAGEQLRASADGARRVAQGVVQHGDELVARHGVSALCRQRVSIECELVAGVEMAGNQLGKQREHAPDLGRVEFAGPGAIEQSVPVDRPSGSTRGIEI